MKQLLTIMLLISSAYGQVWKDAKGVSIRRGEDILYMVKDELAGTTTWKDVKHVLKSGNIKLKQSEILYLNVLQNNMELSIRGNGNIVIWDNERKSVFRLDDLINMYEKDIKDCSIYKQAADSLQYIINQSKLNK